MTKRVSSTSRRAQGSQVPGEHEDLAGKHEEITETTGFNQ
jgi:hypothetical protein